MLLAKAPGTNINAMLLGHGFHGFHGLQGLAGIAEVKALQTALKNLSAATQRSDIDPGVIDGVVGARTVQAVIAAQTLVSAQMDQTKFLILQAALAAGAMTSQAKKAIEVAAVPLTVAVNTAIAKYGKPSIMPVALQPYKTPLTIALIVVGGLILWKMLFSKPAAAKAA